MIVNKRKREERIRKKLLNKKERERERRKESPIGGIEKQKERGEG